MKSENKTFERCGLLVCLFFVLGCASCKTHTPMSVQPVGPPLGVSPDKVDPKEIGFLVVYSATEEHRIEQRISHPHTGYVIRTANGSKYECIENSLDKIDETAMLVALPAGSYTVEAKDSEYGPVIVPVLILPWRTTRVHLKANSSEDFVSENSTNLVRFPSGRIVGWHADRSG